jgi:AcrR family transcriptional regulator
MSGREEILEAAARLFVENGYAATSTRMIAMAVGVKQSSLYYHFANKEDILAGLLPGTVGPSLGYARMLARTGEPAHVQLYALTRYDVSLLCTSRWNLAALYWLPELRSDRFGEFRRDRDRLCDAYGRRIAAGVRTATFAVESVPMATSLVFALVESVIQMRSDGKQVDPVKFPAATAGAVLRLLNCPAIDETDAVDRYQGLAEQASQN